MTGPEREYSTVEIKSLVHPALLRPLPDSVYDKLAIYVRLLYRWNARMNLTTVPPEEWIRLHIAECLRGAQLVPPEATTVLDFGSGGGLPGIPIQLVRPDIEVTLAESQNKKAAFLREAVRELKLERARVFGGRVEAMPRDRQFDLVALRAVDRMGNAVAAAAARIAPTGGCMIFTSLAQVAAVEAMPTGLEWQVPDAVPGTEQRVVLLGRVVR